MRIPKFSTGETLLLAPEYVAVEYRGPTTDPNKVRVRVNHEPIGGAQVEAHVRDLCRPSELQAGAGAGG
jgi:hypothetical protein